METILIVEDDRAVQKALKRLFESEGYKVDVQGDGKSALEEYRNAMPGRRFSEVIQSQTASMLHR